MLTKALIEELEQESATTRRRSNVYRAIDWDGGRIRSR